ncbi:MAG TPA: signal peptidase I [Candidatus Saccharimonadales bacterium]|jgi:signal peptidase I|nr:signal peptidase I [Candidatus Saccharimonadales bacterium]
MPVDDVTEPVLVPATEAPPPDDGLRILKSWTRDLFFSIAFALIIILFVYQPVKVEGGSMEPGLEDQERIFINKLVYRFETIERGDVIVFRYPRDMRKSFIKRVIGIPGDRVRVAKGHVYLNGQPLPEPYVPEDYFDSRSDEERVVKPDTFYVLGDHRSMSNDSREFGLVPRANVYGKAVFGYWPMEKLGTVR